MAKKKKAKEETMLATAEPNKDWEHEDHARTLTKAGEILTCPKKMKGAMGHIKKQKKAFRSIDQLKKFHQQKFGKNGNPEMHDADDMEE